MNFWDKTFAGDDYRYGTTPNAFVREQAHRLTPASHILLPGDGEGRNSVWLASQGHSVQSIDGSAVGLQKAQQLAQRQGINLQTLHTDLTEWTPAPASVDAVVLTFVHLPPPLRTHVHRQSLAALRPGGWLLLEAFTPEQLRYQQSHQSGGPGNAAMLYSLESLMQDFDHQLQPALAWEGEVELNEGAGHQGLAHVVRLLAQVA